MQSLIMGTLCIGFFIQSNHILKQSFVASLVLMYWTADAEEHLEKQMETGTSKQKHSYTYTKLGQSPLII